MFGTAWHAFPTGPGEREGTCEGEGAGEGEGTGEGEGAGDGEDARGLHISRISRVDG